MTKTMTRNNRTSTLVGAAIGLVVFLAVALLPSIVYSGYAGVMLAGAIFGTPVGPSLAVRAIVMLGMILGVTSVAALFTAAGAAAGAVVGALTRGARADRAEPESRGF
jgi:hypothetical protein